jgi:hypothetical protein
MSAARTREGRGLFLAAQLTGRWGARHTADGKVIWAEQEIPDRALQPLCSGFVAGAPERRRSASPTP